MFIIEEDQSENEQNLIPLHFDQKFEDYKNGILLQGVQQQNNQRQFINVKNEDQFRAENYFNILIDQEIDKKLICELINKMKENNSYYNSSFDCEEYQQELDNENMIKQSADVSKLYDPSFDETSIKKC